MRKEIKINGNDIKPPCIKCKIRKLGCHDTCKKFAIYREKVDKIKARYKYEHSVTDNGWGYIPRRKKEEK